MLYQFFDEYAIIKCEPRLFREEHLVVPMKITSILSIACLIFLMATRVGFAFQHGQDATLISIGISLDSFDRQVRPSDRLTLNTDASYRIVALDKCRTVGEIELLEATEFSEFEEAYVFLPDHCLWIEVGTNETAKSVRLEFQLIQRLIDQGLTVTIYHTHVGKRSEFLTHFPAFSDFVLMAMVNAAVANREDLKITYKAITTIGMFEYGLSNRHKLRAFVEHLKATGLGKDIEQNVAYTYYSSERRSEYISAIDACRNDFSPILNSDKGCFPIQTSDFVLDFKPYKAGKIVAVFE